MAPEQAQNDRPDVRNDIYSLGLIMQEMNLTGVDRHIDTLTDTRYRWADMGERILRVNQFIYDYTDSLAAEGMSSDETAAIRETMLNEWQQWSEHIAQMTTKSYKMTEKSWETPQ